MTIRKVTTASVLGFCAGLALASGPAAAQGAKPHAQITITNMRAAPLNSLEIATSGEQSRLVAKLAKPLAPGKSVALKLNKPQGCSYFVLAKFADDVESDSDSMDLCKDRVIRLTE